MADISGFGLHVQVIASATFPSGFDVTQFADDADPFDLPSVQIGDKAMGLNGDLVRWSKANPIVVTLNVIPGSEDDQNLSLLFSANQPGRGKTPAGDDITLVRILPNGSQKTYSAGGCMEFMPGDGVASSGRRKTKAYQFAFENDTGGPG